MHIFGLNETLIAGFQANFQANFYMMMYTFDGAPPADFDSMGFTTNVTDLIRNCNNACAVQIIYPSIRELQVTHQSTLIKSADLIARYKGEAVSMYENGVLTGTSFADHTVYAPKGIVNKSDYRDHKMFELLMYKQANDLNFAGGTSRLTVSTDNNETVEFDYDRQIEVDCFGIKQGTAANTFMRQMVLEYWDSVGSTWLPIVTTVLNVAGYQVVKFDPITASKFRIRKLASGSAGSVSLAFAYFGKFNPVPANLMYNMAVPQWAILVPNFFGPATLTGLQGRLPDLYGNNDLQNTEDFCIMVDCSNLSGTGRIKMNIPDPALIDFKFDYYMAFGQIF